MPARILDDIAVCKLRGKFTLKKVKAEEDLRLEYERGQEPSFGEKRQFELYFNYTSGWARIVGVPDGVIDGLALEFTITRDDSSLSYLLPRMVIYAYMCMSEYSLCSTLLVPTTPPQEDLLFAYLIVPNGKALEFIAEELREVIEEDVRGKRNRFCSSCLYRRVCPDR